VKANLAAQLLERVKQASPSFFENLVVDLLIAMYVELAALIHTSYERSHRTYGARRVHAELREGYGVRVGRKRVARLMRRADLKGVQKRRFRCTTRSGAPERWAPDLVERNFLADRPDALWVADVTYVPTAEGFLYLALVLDVFSRLIVGWA